MTEVLNFKYDVIFEKCEGKIRVVSYNSPHKNNEQELDDIQVAFHGKDLNNNDCSSYKIINWETLEDGKHEVSFMVKFIPNGDSTYDQVFLLNRDKNE